MRNEKNILLSLHREEARIRNQLIQEVRDQLLTESIRDEITINSIKRGGNNEVLTSEGLEPGRIFNLESIRRTCIDYRMRFLSTAHFKGEIPEEALLKIRELERKCGKSASWFIMAPKHLFHLADADSDPLLFAKINDQQYYLVHQWGSDLSRLRKWLVWPAKSLENTLYTLGGISLVLTLVIPNNWIVPESIASFNNLFGYWDYHRVTLFFHLFILFSAITVFYRFAFYRDFSESEWNRKTFN